MIKRLTDEKFHEKMFIRSIPPKEASIMAIGSGLCFIFFTIEIAASKIKRATAILIP